MTRAKTTAGRPLEIEGGATASIVVRVSISQKRAIEKAARKAGISISDLVRLSLPSK